MAENKKLHILTESKDIPATILAKLKAEEEESKRKK